MNSYITGSIIKTLRADRGLTQAQLADRLCVSAKTISKWETGKGFPDISLVDPLAKALGVSIPELLAGEQITNTNRASNLLWAKWYVCPLCGNVIHTLGEAVLSCCGVTLPPCDCEAADPVHAAAVERMEHEYYVSIAHPMTKDHYISFIAYVTNDRVEMVKLYPEGAAEARFFSRGHGYIYWYCNHHGLFRMHV